MILDPKEATPRCQATVDLISRVMRPYLFRVTVCGLPPHAHTRKYTISAETDDSAAIKGMELFVEEFSRKLPGVISIAPKAKLLA